MKYDDSSWELVRVPHDWAISGPFDERAPGSTGKLPWKDVGWYRKTFTVEGGADRRVYFDFDGVMAFPKVYVNGQLAGEWDYGYMSFRVDATSYIRFGQQNVIAVEVDTRRHGSRWYPGAGILRKVRMTVAEPVHVAHWGTFVATPAVSDRRATIRVRSTIENHESADREVTVEVSILDSQGESVCTSKKRGKAPAGGSVEVDQQMFVADPERWDLEHPHLYNAVTTVRAGDEVVDSETVAFGIRTFSFDADRGFFLNGRRVQLYGVNLHHDLGALGAAINRRAMQRQLEIMKEMGVNALRTSHNAPAPEVLELCDQMGIFVWDECFDKWNATADNLGGPENVLPMAIRQLNNFVRRDRNHPSVFVWSVGNEIGTSVDERGDGMSFGRLAAMRDAILRLDDTRPVGIGCHTPNTVDSPVYDPLDLTGWNYGRRYARYREAYPNKPILYSESASTVSTRGHYAFPLANSKTDYPGGVDYVSSYDLSATPWSDILDFEFKLMEDDRFVAGEFVWTGFDYLGEPTPNRRGARSSYFGIVDLAGIPKDRYYLYRSHWRPDVQTIHILPHWNWPDRVGKNVPVFVYTDGDSGELFLNGKSLGRRTKGVVPPKPANLAVGKPTATSFGGKAGAAVDGDDDSAWSAADLGGSPWMQVDLGDVQPVKFLDLALGASTGNAGYAIQISHDGSDWTNVANIEPRTSRRGRGFAFGGPNRARGSRATFDLADQNVQGRFVRIDFTDLSEDSTASVTEFRIYSARYESEYYDVTYQYRLRWNDVIYEPGELKVVVYKQGAKVGEKAMRTAGPPASIRLTPDRSDLLANGEDLSFILVEALDAQGNPAPLADNMIEFDVSGAGKLAAVNNGDQLSLESFQDNRHALFNGKAMLIVRAREDEVGPIEVTARSAGLEPATVSLRTSRFESFETAQTHQDEASSIKVLRDIAYREGDSEAWRLDLAMPAEQTEELRPALVIVHGGGWRGGSRTVDVFQKMMTDYARKGYVAINIDYRLMGEAPFPACIEDVKCAVRWLRAHAEEYKVDPERIGAYGHSAGAHLAMMLAMAPKSAGLEGDGGWEEYSSVVNVAAGGSPPTELGRGTPMAKSVWWPIGYISGDHPPLFLIQGLGDRIVRPELTDDFVEKMKAAGAEIEYMKLEGGHGVAYNEQLEVTDPALEEFFAKHLKPE